MMTDPWFDSERDAPSWTGTAGMAGAAAVALVRYARAAAPPRHGCRTRSAKSSARRRCGKGKVKLDLPPLVENGNAVPVTFRSTAR